MAIVRFVIDGFGQIELNNFAAPRDGRIEAQCHLGDDFTAAPAENGMLLAVDNVTRTVKLPVDASLPVALNYTTEHMYDERKEGLKNFKLEKGTFLPRLGYLSIGDKFTTNCLAYDNSEFTTEEAFVEAVEAFATTAVYGGICENGAIKLSATAPTEGPVLKVIQATTMPDGQFAVKLQVFKA